MCDVLQAEQLLPGAFHIGGYGDVIHEMTEMASLCWGQYEHDNVSESASFEVSPCVVPGTESCWCSKTSYLRWQLSAR